MTGIGGLKRQILIHVNNRNLEVNFSSQQHVKTIYVQIKV